MSPGISRCHGPAPLSPRRGAPLGAAILALTPRFRVRGEARRRSQSPCVFHPPVVTSTWRRRRRDGTGREGTTEGTDPTRGHRPDPGQPRPGAARPPRPHRTHRDPPRCPRNVQRALQPWPSLRAVGRGEEQAGPEVRPPARAGAPCLDRGDHGTPDRGQLHGRAQGRRHPLRAHQQTAAGLGAEGERTRPELAQAGEHRELPEGHHALWGQTPRHLRGQRPLREHQPHPGAVHPHRPRQPGQDKGEQRGARGEIRGEAAAALPPREAARGQEHHRAADGHQQVRQPAGNDGVRDTATPVRPQTGHGPAPGPGHHQPPDGHQQRRQPGGDDGAGDQASDLRAGAGHGALRHHDHRAADGQQQGRVPAGHDGLRAPAPGLRPQILRGPRAAGPRRLRRPPLQLPVAAGLPPRPLAPRHRSSPASPRPAEPAPGPAPGLDRRRGGTGTGSSTGAAAWDWSWGGTAPGIGPGLGTVLGLSPRWGQCWDWPRDCPQG